MNDTTTTGNGDAHEDPKRRQLIADTISRDVASEAEASFQFGGLRVQTMLEVMEMSKMMAVSQQAVPHHLRNNPGMCLAVVLQALEWRMSPFSVANKSYVVNDRIAWESQLIHAVIEQRGPLTSRLRAEYEGEGEERKCFVYGKLRGESEERVWPPRDAEASKQYTLKALRPPTGQTGARKGSPLWDKKPDLQMFYNVSRDWARVYTPDVLLGVYTEEEIESIGPEYAIDVTDAGNNPDALRQRLAAAAHGDDAEGYHPDNVDKGLKGGKGKRKTAEKKGPVIEHQAEASAATPASEAAQGRAALGDDPNKPQTPGGQRAAAAKKKAAEPSLPTTIEEYEANVDLWLPMMKTAKEALQRWENEKAIREACGYHSIKHKHIRQKLSARCAELGGA